MGFSLILVVYRPSLTIIPMRNLQHKYSLSVPGTLTRATQILSPLRGS